MQFSRYNVQAALEELLTLVLFDSAADVILASIDIVSQLPSCARIHKLAKPVYCIAYDKETGQDTEQLSRNTPRVEAVVEASIKIFDFEFTFPFHIYPKPLPVIILGLDFIATLAASVDVRNTEIMIELLATDLPRSMPLGG